MEKMNLQLIDIFIHEDNKEPVLDITLYNASSQTVLPTAAKIEILDVGEFFDCDDQTRSYNAVTQIYRGVVLSPQLRGREQVIKISHLLRSGESDRFQLAIGQRINNPALVYVWYKIKVTIVYNEQDRNITSQPLLLSIPPVDPHRDEIWEYGNDACIAKNKATLNRMALQTAKRSRSVEDAIQSYATVQSPPPPDQTPVVPPVDDPVRIFFSYAPEDATLVKRLDDQLTVLKRNNRITNWHVGMMELGKNVKQEFMKQLQEAHIIVLFISPRFLASQYEIIDLLEEQDIDGPVIIPVLLRSTANLQMTPLSQFVILPRNKPAIDTWSNPGQAFTQVAEEIARVVEKRKRS